MPLAESYRLAMTELATVTAEFAQEVASGRIQIYNEFSLQHEFGHHLRSRQPSRLVQFERHISYFGGEVSSFKKREIDIAIFEPDKKTLHCAIELKFPRNGQYPEQMFSFCKDIQFAEELVHLGFRTAALIAFADDACFYSGKNDGIYSFFRGREVLTGQILKPTGAKDDQVTLRGHYSVAWRPVAGSLKYFLVEVQSGN